MAKEYLTIPFEVKASDIKEDGTFSGMGSLFDSSPDLHSDLVARGAFMETLAKGGKLGTGIMLGWQHDFRGMPPGVWVELRETQDGLFCLGQLALDTQLGKEAYSIMKLGAEKGTWRFSLSIGYDAVDFEYFTPKGSNKRVRLLKKIDLYEISIVNFGAKLGATVTDVKQIPCKQITPIEGGGRYEYSRCTLKKYFEDSPNEIDAYKQCFENLEQLKEKITADYLELKNGLADLTVKAQDLYNIEDSDSFDSFFELSDNIAYRLRRCEETLTKQHSNFIADFSQTLQRITGLENAFRGFNKQKSYETYSEPEQKPKKKVHKTPYEKLGFEPGSEIAEKYLINSED